MKIKFNGAAREVTGSCHLVTVNGYQVLLECGLIQGQPIDEARNFHPFPFEATAIDAVILSHSHIDHSGRLPLLYKRGYKGPIYTHKASLDLCSILLQDSGNLNEKNARSENKKRQTKGLLEVEPLYTREDAKAVMHQFIPMDYGEDIDILPEIKVKFSDAGHILGSSIIELWLKENGKQRKLVFSGDLGRKGAPIIRDPTIIKKADLVIMESTYGNRLHRTREETEQELERIISEANQQKGNILIPAFAVGRSQDLIYLFSQFYEKWGMKNWHIFLDSPMAIKATAVYAQYSELYDAEMLALIQKREQTLLPNLQYLHTAEESMKLNNIVSGAIIIAGSGMCTGGRIRHHLKHHAGKKNNHIIIAGFQVEGTTGRALVNGAKNITVLNEVISVQAQVHTLGGLSAHADQAGLLDWYSNFEKRPSVALVHGEKEAVDVLATELKNQKAARVYKPEIGDEIDLLSI